MGCGNTKEKIEDQMMKMEMNRIEVQMERMKNLQLLKEMEGTEIKRPIIPDYIDQEFLQNYILKRNISSSNDIHSKTILRKRKAKSMILKKKKINFDEGSTNRPKKRKTTLFRKKKTN